MNTILCFLVSAVVLCSFTAFAQDNTSTPNVDRREARQQKRINQGVKSGELSPRETRNLERREAKIRRDEAKAKSDGKVTPAERRKLNREENRASRTIYRKKHNLKTVENPRGK
jgi:hypothetical protein